MVCIFWISSFDIQAGISLWLFSVVHYIPDNMHTVRALWRVVLQWRDNERDGVSNHQPYGCLLNRLFRRRSKNTSKLRVAGLCEENSPVTGEFPAQRASNAENVSIWWRHHDVFFTGGFCPHLSRSLHWHRQNHDILPTTGASPKVYG